MPDEEPKIWESRGLRFVDHGADHIDVQRVLPDGHGEKVGHQKKL